MLIMISYISLLLILVIALYLRNFIFLNKYILSKTKSIFITNYFLDRLFFYEHYPKLIQKKLVLSFFFNNSENYSNKLFTLDIVNNFCILNINAFEFEKNKDRIKRTLKRFKRTSKYGLLYAIFFTHNKNKIDSYKSRDLNDIDVLSNYSNLSVLSQKIFLTDAKILHVVNLLENQNEINSFKEIFKNELDENFFCITQATEDFSVSDSLVVHSFIKKVKNETKSSLIANSLALCSEIKWFVFSLNNKLDYLHKNSNLDSTLQKYRVIFKNLSYIKNNEEKPEDISNIIRILDLKNSFSHFNINSFSYRLFFSTLFIFVHVIILSNISISSFQLLNSKQKVISAYAGAALRTSVAAESSSEVCNQFIPPTSVSFFSPIYIPSWSGNFDKKLSNQLHAIQQKIEAHHIVCSINAYIEDTYAFNSYKKLSENFLESLNSISNAKTPTPINKQSLEKNENEYNQIESLLNTHPIKYQDLENFKSQERYKELFFKLEKNNTFSSIYIKEMKDKLDFKFTNNINYLLSLRSPIFNKQIFSLDAGKNMSLDPKIEQMMTTIYTVKSTLENFKKKKENYFSTSKPMFEAEDINFVAENLSKISTTARSIDPIQFSESANVFYKNFISQSMLEIISPLMSDPKKLQDTIFSKNDLNLLQVSFTKIFDSLSFYETMSSFTQQLSLFIKTNYSFIFNEDLSVLRSKNAYMFLAPSISMWDGKTNLISSMFLSSSNPDLKSYIIAQNKIISDFFYTNTNNFINNYEKFSPYFTINSNEYSFWKNIKNYLNNTGEIAPISILNELLLKTFSNINLGNCYETLLPISLYHEDDYFYNIYNELLDVAKSRCIALRSLDVVRQYNSLANLFNTTVAGNFPFVEKADKLNQANDLTPQSYQNFIDVFNKFLDNNSSFISNESPFGRQNKVINRFIKQIKQINSLIHFQKNPDSDEFSPKNIVLKFNFRENRAKEYLADQIYSWKIFSSEKEILYSAASLKNTGTLTWKYGTPLNIIVKLADSSAYNVEAKDRISLNDGKKLNSQEYGFYDESPWAMFHLIALHQQCGGVAEQNACYQNYLKFTVPLKNGIKMVFYSQIYLQNNADKSFAPPPAFPAKAPLAL